MKQFGFTRLTLAGLAALLFNFSSLVAQPLTITPGGAPETLIETLFTGQGITVSNVTYQLAPNAYGTFYSASPSFGADSGLVLTTGSINNAIGPNNYVINQSQNSGADNGQPGDPALDTLFQTNTFDAAIIEFDFTSQTDRIQFEYIFGSEDYPTYAPPLYTDGYFNDRFAFFLSGPGIPQPINIAVVPGSDPPQPVSVQTINPVTNVDLYRDNAVMGALFSVTDYNGLTQRLVSQYFPVVPCTTYHLKITIADGADHVFDSGVFLAAHSFKSVGQGLEAFVSKTDVTVNGATDGKISVATVGGTNPKSYSINGGDFQTSSTFSGLAAGDYIVTVKDANGCTQTDTVTINEPPVCENLPVFVIPTDVTCAGGNDGTALLNIFGGTPPYFISLNGGSLTTDPFFTGLVAGNYTVKVIDLNNCVGETDFVIKEPEKVLRFMSVMKTGRVCPGCTNGKIIISGIGGIKPYEFSLDGENWQTSGVFNGLGPGSYTVYIRDVNGCLVSRVIVLGG